MIKATFIQSENKAWAKQTAILNGYSFVPLANVTEDQQVEIDGVIYIRQNVTVTPESQNLIFDNTAKTVTDAGSISDRTEWITFEDDATNNTKTLIDLLTK
jgi:hypothetical protein